MMDTFFNAASLPPAFLEDLNVVDNEYLSWENAEQIRDPDSISTDSSDSEQEEGTSELCKDRLVYEECPEVDKVEEKLVTDFLEKGCSCTFGPYKESLPKLWLIVVTEYSDNCMVLNKQNGNFTTQRHSCNLQLLAFQIYSEYGIIGVQDLVPQSAT